MLKSKSHPEVILSKWISRNSKLKKPLEHPLSDSSEGEKKGQTLNKCLSEEKAKLSGAQTYLLFLLCSVSSAKTSSLALMGKTEEGQNVFPSVHVPTVLLFL